MILPSIVHVSFGEDILKKMRKHLEAGCIQFPVHILLHIHPVEHQQAYQTHNHS